MLIISALVMTALVIFVALVVDYGFVRQNRQANKSATDFAAAAGIRALDDASGGVNVWEGICAARDFLVVNDPELAPLTPVDPATLAPVSDPCDSKPVPPVYCTTPATWGTFVGLADGGRIKVRIQNGYDLGGDPDFPEDGEAYAADNGDDDCEHLAVIIEENEDAKFGGIAGSDGYDTKIRSVARVNVGDGGLSTAALVLLEQTGCKAIEIEGGSNASITVDGYLSSPGIIHSDSDGSTCSGDYIFSVGVNSVTSPRIIAGAATAVNAAGVYEPGVLTSYSLAGGEAAQPSATYDPATTPRKVCAERDPVAHPTDCTETDPVTGAVPIANDLVTRAPADERYLGALRTTLANVHTWTDSARPPNTTDPAAADYWHMITDCSNAPLTAIVEERVFINCKGGEWKAKGFTFGDAVSEIVVDGHVVLEGGSLIMGSPDIVYIGGKVGEPGIRTAGSGAKLSVNTGVATPTTDCDTRQSYLFNNSLLTTDRAKVVVGIGGLETEGKLGEIRMCATTLFLVDNTHTDTTFGSADGPCAIQATMPTAPYANGCEGRITVKGTASLDWSAPNVTEGNPTPFFDDFEDLAFWSETHVGNTIEGSGQVELAGIFFTPNADPFRVAGEKDETGVSKFDLRDAQFFTRRLQVAGGGDLVLAPQPKNAIEIPVLSGFTLVR